MAANIYMKSVTVSGIWARLSDTKMVVDATIVTSALNAMPVFARIDGGVSAPWQPGVSISMCGVDLSQWEVKGTIGDTVLVVGSTPGTCKRAASRQLLVQSDIES